MERQSDDGEPQGTAGLPILEILRGRELINVIVVVTRYFGGTLLGTGGLVRAYGRACKEVLDNSVVTEKALYCLISVETDYNLSGKIQHEILNSGIILKDTLYTECVKFFVYIPLGEDGGFSKRIVDLSSNQAVIHKLDEVYGCFVEGEFVVC